MLTRQHRLTGLQNFKTVQTKGKVFQSQNFGIAIFNRQDDGPSRFGFVVSTKIAKGAADRNLAKRKMSEGVRTSVVDTKPGYDVIFLAKPSIIRAPTDVVMKEVKVTLAERKLIK